MADATALWDWSTAVAVYQAARALLGISLVQSLQLPLGDAQQLGRFSVDQSPELRWLRTMIRRCSVEFKTILPSMG
jgi:hypothetical protein